MASLERGSYLGQELSTGRLKSVQREREPAFTKETLETQRGRKEEETNLHGFGFQIRGRKILTEKKTVGHPIAKILSREKPSRRREAGLFGEKLEDSR